MTAFTPAELLSRLDQRFRVLAGGRRTVVERHRTLRAAIDWSYQLLDERERTLLDRLGVFAGGFTLEAAEAITAGGPVDGNEIWDSLDHLVRQSLVVAEADVDGDALPAPGVDPSVRCRTARRERRRRLAPCAPTPATT